MAEQKIVLLALHDGARAERITALLEADGDFLTTLDAGVDADVSLTEEGDRLRITGVPAAVSYAASAVLPAVAQDELIFAAIRLVAAGLSVVRTPAPEAEDEEHALDAAEADRRQSAPALSAREIEVLNLLADGAPNKVIARRLGISVHTAKFHVASLLSKLGAANRTDAIAIAMREGLVPV